MSIYRHKREESPGFWDISIKKSEVGMTPHSKVAMFSVAFS